MTNEAQQERRAERRDAARLSGYEGTAHATRRQGRLD